jgi:hypothetical protein
MSTEREREWVRDILLNNRLFFPTRSAFNDPFDCRIPLSWDGVTLDEMEQKLLDVYRRNPPKGWKGSIMEFVKEQRANGSIAQLLEPSLGKFVTEAKLDDLRVLCLCERSDGILMWSHYADNHEGVCLEFTVLKESYFDGAISVIYASDYPQLKVTMGSRELADGMVRTKATHWAYESEWRVLNVEVTPLHDFPKECLSGVILGCQISAENENLITEWLAERSSPAALYRAVKALDKFAVRIEKVRGIGPPLM